MIHASFYVALYQYNATVFRVSSAISCLGNMVQELPTMNLAIVGIFS